MCYLKKGRIIAKNANHINQYDATSTVVKIEFVVGPSSAEWIDVSTFRIVDGRMICQKTGDQLPKE